jgi:hypothetical protein
MYTAEGRSENGEKGANKQAHGDRQWREPEKVDTRGNAGVENALGGDARYRLFSQGRVEECGNGPSGDGGNHADLDTTGVKLWRGAGSRSGHGGGAAEDKLNWDRPWNR